ncbi:hypothetical protein [Marinicauda salina]|uniref:hypothetical protein n=1 Tax=Marinicauda salina TaxID=2135793 RepID=UPI0011B20605|nr:hypothetical protein [Marinicauda salina]
MRSVAPSLRACCIIACAAALTACASAPLDLAFQRERAAAPVETELRDAAREMTDQVEAAGWSLSEDGGVSMGGFLDRLVRGGRQGAPDQSPVERYLAEAGDAPGPRLEADIAAASAMSSEVARNALAVASTGASLDSDALARDIAAAESALGAARRARAFFVEVRASAPEGADAPGLESALVDLDASIAALATAADALAERRWAGEDALVG